MGAWGGKGENGRTGAKPVMTPSMMVGVVSDACACGFHVCVNECAGML